MREKVRLIIEMPKEEYEVTRNAVNRGGMFPPYTYIGKGTPLDVVKEELESRERHPALEDEYDGGWNNALNCAIYILDNI